jgi:hypothetical protein
MRGQRWVWDEGEQRSLELLLVVHGVWKDKDGKFWFNDETQANICGPYDTQVECERAAKGYGDSL